MLCCYLELPTPSQKTRLSLIHNKHSKWKKLGGFKQCPTGNASCKTVVTIKVTNNTGVAWSDYHIRFVDTEAFDFMRITHVDFVARRPFNAMMIEKNGILSEDHLRRSVITYSSGTVALGDEVTFVMDVFHFNSIDVFGRPSVKKMEP